jgi:hypothetical protein
MPATPTPDSIFVFPGGSFSLLSVPAIVDGIAGDAIDVKLSIEQSGWGLEENAAFLNTRREVPDLPLCGTTIHRTAGFATLPIVSNPLHFQHSCVSLEESKKRGNFKGRRWGALERRQSYVD